jgi:hypothetical protein
LFLISWTLSFAQNPHGEELKMDCLACHTTEGWEISKETWKFEKEKKNSNIEINRIRDSSK